MNSKDKLTKRIIETYMIPYGIKPELTGNEDCCPNIPKEVIEKQLKRESKLGEDWWKK